MGGQEVLVDTSSGIMRPLVPALLRRQVFAAVHGLAHPGIRATRRLVASRYLWLGLAKDIAAWCRDCQACQRAKVTKQPAAAVQPIPVPTVRFTHVHVDLVWPLPPSAEGYQYIFTAIDRSTRWAEAYPLKAVTTADFVAALVSGWVARFGVPACITSDRGVQFVSSLWAALMSGCTAHHDDSLSPTEQRSHRAVPSPLEGRSTCQGDCSRLAAAFALGAAWASCGAAGGFGSVGGGVGVWGTVTGARPVSVGRRAAAS
jgi:Integrase zinc binding domain/Integrase core domain